MGEPPFTPAGGTRRSTPTFILMMRASSTISKGMKERLQLNIEFVRPENFVPALRGSEARHLFIKTIGKVSFLHYDPYAQMLSKVVRGFPAGSAGRPEFPFERMVDPVHFRSLVYSIPETEFQKYPALSRDAVLEAVDDFLEQPE